MFAHYVLSKYMILIFYTHSYMMKVTVIYLLILLKRYVSRGEKFDKLIVFIESLETWNVITFCILHFDIMQTDSLSSLPGA